MAKRKQPGKPIARLAKRTELAAAPAHLLDDVRALIRQTRAGVAQAVNSALALLYWQVGHRIRTEILKQKRAEYGQEILPTLSAKLTPEHGNGFSERNLARMVRFAEVFPSGNSTTRCGWPASASRHGRIPEPHIVRFEARRRPSRRERLKLRPPHNPCQNPSR